MVVYRLSPKRRGQGSARSLNLFARGTKYMQRAVAVWFSRLLAVALALLLGAFALDAFDSAVALPQQLLGFAVHLAPAALVAAALFVAWRAPGLGAICFLLLAGAYAVLGGGRPRGSWYAVIVIPLIVLALLNGMLWHRARPRGGGAGGAT